MRIPASREPRAIKGSKAPSTGATLQRAAGQRAANAAGRGQLVVVTCADAGRLDLMLRAAERHAGAKWPATLLEPITTRCLPAGGGLVMKPNGFNELDRLGALTLTWRQGREWRGYPVSMLARLATGENVVAGVPQDLEAAARAAWADVSVVRFSAGTESLRERLSPRASFSRAARAKAGDGALLPMHRESYDVRVEDCADVGLAIRNLAMAVASCLTANEAGHPSAGVSIRSRTAQVAPEIADVSLASRLAGKRGAKGFVGIAGA